ncbi:MAG TPA: FtsX-like permease family protein [Gemmatimonadaceae bacterium]|nr:FtsX-like permease family protein [Gemmatimonadaceae bacterium]
MSRKWHSVISLAWRESRNARRRLLLFMSSISIGVAALVAIDSYSGNVTRSIAEQSKALLGADLVLRSRAELTDTIEALIDSLDRSGAEVGRMTSFASMARVARTEGTRLVQVRAVTPDIPFYGRIETAPAGRWDALQAGQNALVDEALLTALDAQVGDSLVLGYASFRIIGTLVNVPGDVGIAAAFGPRVYIPHHQVAATRLLTFGARAEYEAMLRLPSSVDAEQLSTRMRPVLEAQRTRARTVEDTEEDLTEGVAQLNRFLGVVGLVSLLLGGIGVASAIHAYIAEKIDTVAVLRCLGGTGGQVLAIYVLEAAALGLLGAVAGVALGLGVQFALPRVIGDFVPVDVDLRLEPSALWVGLAVGVWVAAIFAILPLLAVRRISPLQALRRQTDAPRRRRLWHDVPRLVAVLALVASVVIIAVLRTGDALEGLGMSAAIAAAIGVLSLSAGGLSWLARRLLREQWPFVVRQGIASLYRPANQTRPVVLALGFGAFLISTLYLAQANLLNHLTLSAEASRANLAFFDIQADQAAPLDSLLRRDGLPILQRVPIVPMRIASINGRSVAELSRQRPSWALRREYRSSYRDTLVKSERLIAGRWFPERPGAAGPPYDASFEREIATELELSLGDTVVWDVQGLRIPTRVSSLREVDWARFEPNFFVIFEPRALAGAPESFVVLTQSPDARLRASLQREVVDRFPNVSSIDLSLIQQAVGRILDKVSVAIRFMALFSVTIGALVLVSAVAASRRQRLREGVLLKTLGATRGQIGRIMLAEYAILGLLGSLTGMVLSLGGAWALLRFVFELPFTPVVMPLLVIAGAMMLLTVLIGLLSGRDVFAETPMAALREGAG